MCEIESCISSLFIFTGLIVILGTFALNFYVYIYPITKKNNYEGKAYAFKIENVEERDAEGITYDFPVYFFNV